MSASAEPGRHADRGSQPTGGAGSNSTLPALAWSDLGRMPYDQAHALQRDLVDALKAGRGESRLLLVEHPAVITGGRRAKPEHLRADESALRAERVNYHRAERGGDMTYHGPGQLVAYPILDLRQFRKDVRWLSGALAETARRTLAAFGIESEAKEGPETGLWSPLPSWIIPDDPLSAEQPSQVAYPYRMADGRPAGKIAALGLRIERWISYHGLSLNIDPDLRHFELIVPCGLERVRCLDMAGLLGRAIDRAEVLPVFVSAFGEVFERRMQEASAEDLKARAAAGLTGAED